MTDEQMFAQGLGRVLAGLTPRGYYFHHTNDPDATLSYAHYSDPAFDGDGAVIYGAKQNGLRWIDPDDLWKDRTRAQVVSDTMIEIYGDKDTARRREAFLGGVLGTPVKLVCVVAGTNAENGYSWYKHGYTENA